MAKEVEGPQCWHAPNVSPNNSDITEKSHTGWLAYHFLLILMHIHLFHKRMLSNILAHWKQGLCCSRSWHSHESWMIAWIYKTMSIPTPLHSLRSVLKSSHDQMLKGLYSCGLNTCRWRVSKPMGQCWRRSDPDSRSFLMFQMRRGFPEMDELHYFGGCTRFMNSATMVRLDWLIWPLLKPSKCKCVAFCQNLHHKINEILIRQVSFLDELCRFN